MTTAEAFMADKKMDKRIVTGTFRDRESAERGYDAIAARGYKSDDIHVLMTDDTRKRLFKDVKDTKDGKDTKLGNKALEGAGVGGAIGGAVGATTVGLAAAATSLVVPGLGLLVAGPLAGALAGGAAGATAGGLIGTLVGAGIPEDRAKTYEADLKNGGVIVGVEPRNDEDARYFENDWQREYAHR
jgi:hypothetical protein